MGYFQASSSRNIDRLKIEVCSLEAWHNRLLEFAREERRIFVMRLMSRSKISLVSQLLLLVISASATGSKSTAVPVSSPGSLPMASQGYYPEVRLRKLHLVRPDLIPYPIYYEVYC